MGRRVDKWALGALAAAGLYLFFLSAWDSVALACGAVMACFALLGRFLRDHPPPRLFPSPGGRERLLALAALPEAEARQRLTALVGSRYPDEDFRLTPVLKHPETTLSSGDILNAWKANREAGRLVVAATCPCEPRALLFARQLRAPSVAVVDSAALRRLLRAQEPPEDAPFARTDGFRRRLCLLAARMRAFRATPKAAFVAAALLALYLRNGQPLYLFSALALLFRLGAALLGGRRRKRLFDGEGE